MLDFFNMLDSSMLVLPDIKQMHRIKTIQKQLKMEKKQSKTITFR